MTYWTQFQMSGRCVCLYFDGRVCRYEGRRALGTTPGPAWGGGGGSKWSAAIRNKTKFNINIYTKPKSATEISVNQKSAE